MAKLSSKKNQVKKPTGIPTQKVTTPTDILKPGKGDGVNKSGRRQLRFNRAALYRAAHEKKV